MSVIAVAGGTGHLGHAIVDALVAEGNNVIVLARETSETKEKEIGARILAANYDDIPALAKLLEDNNIEVVISTLNALGNAAPETALIQAADKSSTTKRYVPSVWGIKFTEHIASYFPLGDVKLGYAKTLEATSLEHTTVFNGYFLDYFVLPKIKSYLNPMSIILDIPNNFAAIPGSGDVPVVFTHTFDIARFIATLVKQPRWQKESHIVGDKVTWNEFLHLAEEAKGIKFTVVHDSIEKLKTGQITELPSHPLIYPFFPKEMLQGLLAAFGIMFEEGEFNLQPARSLNDEFPEIKPRTVKELVSEAWKED